MQMPVEQCVGQRIRERREELGMSSTEFGSRLGEFLGKPWPRQAVSAAELGKRSLGAAEMVAIAYVLDTSTSRLFTPPFGISEFELPGGRLLPCRATPGELDRPAIDAARDQDLSRFLAAVSERCARVSRGSRRVCAEAEKMNSELDELAAFVQRVTGPTG